MAIDVHVHYQDQPGFLEKLLGVYADHGIDRICLNGGGPMWNQVGNAEVETAFKQYPDRVIGFGFIYLGTDRPELVDDLYQRGFKGLKTQNPKSFYDDRAFFPFYERAEKYRMPILFHTGIGARGKNVRESGTSSNYMRPILLDTIARAFPDLVLIAAHLGFPWCAEAAFLTIMQPNLYADLAGIDRTETYHPSLVNYRDLLLWHPNGFGKILFGTEGQAEPAQLATVKKDYEDLLVRHQASKDMIESVMGGRIAEILGI